MHIVLSTARQRLGAVTFGLLLVIGLLVISAATASRSSSLTPRDLAGDSLPLGRTVVITGSVISWAPGVLVLAPKDAETPTVRVEFVDAMEATGFG
ncbi:MAG: hypothetical protein C0418_03705, partial [Coriobacteriaceae bacterium]|nr:hypothetical protein [Coriobacteriaceae bacterium]